MESKDDFGDYRNLIRADMDRIREAGQRLIDYFVEGCAAYGDIIRGYDPQSEGEKVAAVRKCAAQAINSIIEEHPPGSVLIF